MELSIKNFRSIIEKKYVFPKGNTLITGESGAGKSTILESIIWCFYGGSNVIPFGVKKIITRVEIKLDDMRIIRTKPPDKCQIIFDNDKKLEHDEAQEYINNLFGGKCIWENSSYLKQDSRSGLLFNSSQEKFSLIKEIIFGNEDTKNSPEVFLEKLSKFSKDLDSKMENRQGKIDLLLETINESKTSLTDYEKLKEDERRFQKSLNKYDSIKEGIDKINVQLSTLDTLETNKKKLETTIEELEDYPELTIDIIQNWKTWFDAKDQLSLLDTSFERITFHEDIEELETELRMSARQYQEYKKNSNKAKTLNVIYEREKISEKVRETELEVLMIEKYTNYINIMKNVKKIENAINNSQENLTNLEEKEKPYSDGFSFILTKLGIDNSTFSTDKVTECNDKISNIMTDYLKCPHCNKNTVLEKGELVAKECKFMTKTELEKIKRNLKNIVTFYDRKEKIQTEIDNYLDMKDKMDIPEEVQEQTGDLKILKKYINDLNSIHFIDYDEEEFLSKKELLKKLKHQEKVEILENKIKECYDIIFDEYKKPVNFSSYFEKYRKLVSEKEFLEDYLRTNSSGDSVVLNQKLDKLKELIEKLDNFKVYQIIKEKETLLEELEKENQITIKKREKCHTLKKIIEEESALTFENMILNFNDILNEIVGEIFEDITIELGMFKKMKARGELKPQFNMKVLLKGNEYDNLHFLSGGEKDRISIALTLTLSSLLNTPIIMFDESMSSLDEEMRERCLELIKKHAGDKILINICHSTIEGYYDTIIRK